MKNPKSTRESIIALLAEDIRSIAEKRAERAWTQTFAFTASASEASLESKKVYSAAIQEMREVFQD